MSYTPRAGSVPERVVQYLRAQPAGTALTTTSLAEACDADAAGLSVTLASALRAGVLRRDKRGRQAFWTLGPGTAPPPDEPDDDPDTDPPQRKVVAWDGDVPRPPLFPQVGEGTTTPRVNGKPAAPTLRRLPDPIRCALWSDGTLQLQRGGQDVLLLPADDVRELLRYLERMAEAPEQR